METQTVTGLPATITGIRAERAIGNGYRPLHRYPWRSADRPRMEQAITESLCMAARAITVAITKARVNGYVEIANPGSGRTAIITHDQLPDGSAYWIMWR